jgi:hypothetical protein
LITPHSSLFQSTSDDKEGECGGALASIVSTVRIAIEYTASEVNTVSRLVAVTTVTMEINTVKKCKHSYA